MSEEEKGEDVEEDDGSRGEFAEDGFNDATRSLRGLETRIVKAKLCQ